MELLRTLLFGALYSTYYLRIDSSKPPLYTVRYWIVPTQEIDIYLVVRTYVSNPRRHPVDVLRIAPTTYFSSLVLSYIVHAAASCF